MRTPAVTKASVTVAGPGLYDAPHATSSTTATSGGMETNESAVRASAKEWTPNPTASK